MVSPLQIVVSVRQLENDGGGLLILILLRHHLCSAINGSGQFDDDMYPDFDKRAGPLNPSASLR